MPTKSKTIWPKGTVFGQMVSLAEIVGTVQKRRWKCAMCGYIRWATIASIRSCIAQTPGSTGCAKCNHKVNPRSVKPVIAGEQFGCMVAVTALPSRGTPGEFQCVVCGSLRTTTASYLNTGYAGGGCQTCNAKQRATKPKLSNEECKQQKREYNNRYKRNQRTAEKSLGPRTKLVQGTKCGHEKELICIDPGEVEIWRCRECQNVGTPAWKAPLMHRGHLFPGVHDYGYDDGSNSGFENVVRAIEDAWEKEPEEFDSLEFPG